METVYLVTDGCYSDYHVEAAFSTEEKADAYAGAVGHGGVEEFTLDPTWEVCPKGMSVYLSWIHKDGQQMNAWRTSYRLIPSDDEDVFRDNEKQLNFKFFARNLPHARKITTDRWQEWIRKEANA